MDARTPELRGRPPATLRRLATVRTTVRSWRLLTGGARTLVACSGGADSTALLLALRSATENLVVGHVIHDMRSREEAEADRDFVAWLATELGVGFYSATVERGTVGNTENALRLRRYDALSTMASQVGAPFVASAHHADDQLESMLLALTRGAGPSGLAGVQPTRALSETVTLVRPMLALHRADAEQICAVAGVVWRHDRTNDDGARARAALRRNVVPGLRTLRPTAAIGAARSADLLREAAAVVADRVVEVFGEDTVWARSRLARERAIVIGTGLRSAHQRLTGGRGADRLPLRVVERAVRAIGDHRSDLRTFVWPHGVALTVGAHEVRMAREDYATTP